MPNLIDRVRKDPPKPRLLTVFGGDPDMDTTGWAWVSAGFNEPMTGPAQVFEASIGLIRPTPGKRRDLEQADAMAVAIQHFRCPRSDVAFVEAQQVYPTPDENPGERIAKANDLLRLAQVTGFLQQWALTHNVRLSRSVLPASWKGQQRKEQTLAMLQARLATVEVKAHDRKQGTDSFVVVKGAMLNKLPGMMGHALDALGIAIYGLDLLARHPDMLLYEGSHA